MGVIKMRNKAAADDAKRVCNGIGSLLPSNRARAPALAAVSPNLLRNNIKYTI
jgi:hypothetical protein